MRRALEVLQGAVTRNTVKEAAKSAASRIVLFWISHQGHENVLYNFLGRPGVSAHAQCEAIERRLVAPIKERKCLLVAFTGAPEQHVVSFLVRDAHLPDKTLCPALNIHSRAAKNKFPRWQIGTRLEIIDIKAG